MLRRLWIIVFIGTFLLSSCGTKVIDKRIHLATSEETSIIGCDTSIYGDACNKLDDFMVVKKDELLASNIKKGRSIGGVAGSLEQGAYLACHEEGEVGCVSNAEYKAINVNNHKSKIISGQSILGVEGSFVVPSTSQVISTASYGIAGNMSGMMPNCSNGNSGCYIKPYDEGVSGFTLKALDYNSISTGVSHIKNGYELISGITGTQPLCENAGSSCYVDASFKAVNTSELIASNIKDEVNLGGVTGTYSGVSACSDSSHTQCVANNEYPSVPAGLTSSLLSSASINGVYGSIGLCSAGGSSCYIGSNSLTAAETSKLIASNIKNGVSLGGVTGAYPSELYPLEGSDSTQDLTSSNFNSSILSSSAFEWFDSKGNRHIRTGDPDIVADNIKAGKNILGVNGEYYVEDPHRVATNSYGFAVIDNSGAVSYNGYSSESNWIKYSSVSSSLSSDVVSVFANGFGAFAALKSDGSVVTWGHSYSGGNSSGVTSHLTSGVKNIFHNECAFAAVKEDKVVSWGYPECGGGNHIDSVSNVVDVLSTYQNGYGAFAALTNTGKVVTWGSIDHGGSSDGVSAQLNSGVIKIVHTNNAFAALKSDTSVVFWGDPEGPVGNPSDSVLTALSSGVTDIFSNEYAFVVLKEDGSVVSWGNSSYGGDSSNPTGGSLSSGVVNIFSNNYAFVALKSDGTVVTWGNSSYGGDPTYSYNSFPQVSEASGSLTNVKKVFATHEAFAALKADGSVVTWGNSDNGGNSSSVLAQLSSGVVDIFSDPKGTMFAALKDDRTVVSWGNHDSGTYYDSVKNDLTNVKKVFATQGAFAALKADGSVIGWGAIYHGGDPNNVYSQLAHTGASTPTGIVTIYPSVGNYYAYFVGLRDDGTYIAWGTYDSNY